MATVFISHRSTDKRLAAQLAEDIRAAGPAVWFDEWEIGIGDSIVAKIDQGLSETAYLVLCLSASGVDTPWISREWMSALHRQLEGAGVKLLPVDFGGGALPAILADLKHTDLTKDWAGGLRKLLKAIKGDPVMKKKSVDVYIAHAPDEEEIAERLAKPIEDAGYTVHHRGTVLVGEFYHEEVSKVLDQNGPVIVCATIAAKGTGWAHEVVNAVKASHGAERLFPVRIDAKAYTKPLISGDIKLADCSGNFDHGITALLTSLKAKFPLDDTPPPPEVPTITRWLEALVTRIGFIEISGIGSGVGRTRDASRYPIEQLYTTLRSRGEAMARGGGGQTVADLLPRHHRLLIEGQPGAGKTTFLHLVTAMLGRDILGHASPDGQPWRRTYLALDEDAPLRVPLFLKLSELAVTLEKDPLTSGDGRHRLLDLLDKYASAEPGPAWRAHWEGLLTRGEAILLLDGLDEVADETLRLRVFTIFRDACEHWKASPIIVTSRPIAVETVKTMGFHHAVIEPFGEREIKEFIERWVAALHRLPIGQRPEGDAGDKADRITATVLARPAIRRLAANPVMLTCLCVVHWNEGDLPDGRSRLYRAVIRWLIAARTTQRKEAGFTDRFAHEAFPVLALAMMSGTKRVILRKGSREVPVKLAVIDLEAAAKAVEPLVKRHFPSANALPRAREWLRFECLWSGIVEERAGSLIGFWHLTFQEYLAAYALALLGDGDTAEDWWPRLQGRLDDLQWRETVDLFPGALFDEGGARRVDLLLERVATLDGRTPALAVAARVFGILGRLLAPMTAYGYRAKPEIEAAQAALRARILPIFELPGATEVPVKLRIEAAEALGRGGDPRLAKDTMLPLPGSGGVSLGKYPVTVQEFQPFVEAGGYHERELWSEAGWRFRIKEDWSVPGGWDGQIEHPNRPVTGVSWYEAEAWCRWRSLGAAGEAWRLPTETEWQQAASLDGRTYPWGEAEPSPEVANFDRNVGQPTPVGTYPAGNGPLGHCDLAGNVWEWCSDEGKPGKDQPGPLESKADRVLRGGSWYGDAQDACAAYRLWTPPDGRDSVIGFRCSRVQIVSQAGKGER